MSFLYNFSLFTFVYFAVGYLPPTEGAENGKPERPNFVIILTDDLGYGDLGVQGHPTISTPHLDRMAIEGQRWTDFYAAANVCTPSRAALLSGRWPVRNGMTSDRRRVLTARAAGGRPGEEISLATHLREHAGYATGAFGKWHLGHRPEFLPNRHGFDTFFGTPYSNDEIPAPEWRGAFARKDYWNSPLFYEPRSEYWDIPLLHEDTELERPVNQTTLTARTTEATLAFMRDHRHRPFFVYLAYHMPHVPLFASEPFLGSTSRGIYGDAIAEMDHGLGRIIDFLRRNDLGRKTLVVFTSDNGPWTVFGTHGGSTGMLRGDKGSTWEGGHRVPTLFWWPGQIPGGSVVREIGSQLDIFATFCSLAGVRLPDDRIMDSLNLAPTLLDGMPSPRSKFLYFQGTEVFAIREGRFKMHVSTQPGFGLERPRSDPEPPALYHLGRDPGERHNISSEQPDLVEAMRARLKLDLEGLTYGKDQLEEQLP